MKTIKHFDKKTRFLKKREKPKTRKDLRKDKRKQKKLNRFSYHNSKTVKVDKDPENSKKTKKGKFQGKNSKGKQDSESENSEFDDDDEEIPSDFEENVEVPKKAPNVSKFDQRKLREKDEENEYYKGIKENRIEQLKKANEEEDKVIKRYETLLKLNKRKTKNGTKSTKSFNDGLEYLLDLCTDENIQKMYTAAKEVAEDQSDDEFGQDFNLALGNTNQKPKKKMKNSDTSTEPDAVPQLSEKAKKRMEKLKEVEMKYFGDENEHIVGDGFDSCEGSDSEEETGEQDFLDSEDEQPAEIQKSSKKNKNVKFAEEHPKKKQKLETLADSEDSDFDIMESGEEDGESEFQSENSDMKEDSDPEQENNKEMRVQSAFSSDDSDVGSAFDGSDDEDMGDEDFGTDISSDQNDKKPKKKVHTGDWEDIYGRKRDKDGNVIIESSTKYIPPHMRAKLAGASEADMDPKRREKLRNLQKQLKGLINRLAEANLHRISIDVENIYSSNARHDVNSTLTDIILSSLILPSLSQERLILEHVLLITTLHGNIGSEIGAFFLEIVVDRFNQLFANIDEIPVANKEIDNIIFILCHMYTFKIFKYTLIYELLNKLCEKLSEKTVECMLLVLRSIGFILRKDDPLALKNFIVSVQKKANSLSEDVKNNSRVMYMVDILMAIKNNNMTKIPQYDPSLVEQFRKLFKQFVRNGKYVTTLNISMEDLSKVDERGKWWLVGSAWAGNENTGAKETLTTGTVEGDQQRDKIFALARKQHMNTDDKKNIFYILMTAEDYLDAFEKILSTVKDERSIVAVLIHCCLSEKEYNPYYSVLAQKFCDHNRKYHLTIQYTVWDKIKVIEELSIKQITNLSRFLIFLIENGNLPISVLKVIEFSKIEKSMLRFLRQIMLGLLLGDEEKWRQVFERIAPSLKLASFKDSLRLFMKCFIMKDDNKKMSISDEQLNLLKTRMKLTENLLMNRNF